MLRRSQDAAAEIGATEQRIVGDESGQHHQREEQFEAHQACLVAAWPGAGETPSGSTRATIEQGEHRQRSRDVRHRCDRVSGREVRADHHGCRPAFVTTHPASSATNPRRRSATSAIRRARLCGAPGVRRRRHRLDHLLTRAPSISTPVTNHHLERQVRDNHVRPLVRGEPIETEDLGRRIHGREKAEATGHLDRVIA